MKELHEQQYELSGGNGFKMMMMGWRNWMGRFALEQCRLFFGLLRLLNELHTNSWTSTQPNSQFIAKMCEISLLTRQTRRFDGFTVFTSCKRFKWKGFYFGNSLYRLMTGRGKGERWHGKLVNNNNCNLMWLLSLNESLYYLKMDFLGTSTKNNTRLLWSKFGTDLLIKNRRNATVLIIFIFALVIKEYIQVAVLLTKNWMINSTQVGMGCAEVMSGQTTKTR